MLNQLNIAGRVQLPKQSIVWVSREGFAMMVWVDCFLSSVHRPCGFATENCNTKRLHVLNAAEAFVDL